MNEDEIAQMFLDECLYNAGLKEESPFERKQVGSNPAVLNEPDGQDKYTVCGGMDTHSAEEWGPGAPLSDESVKG